MPDDGKPSFLSAVGEAGVSLVPLVGGAAGVFWRYVQDRDRWRAEQVAQAVADEAGDEDEALQRLAADDRLSDMLILAVEAGSRTALDAKRIAMGRVVGRALLDDADIDDHAALLAALAALEAPHFRELTRVATNTPPPSPLVSFQIPEPYRAQLIAQGTLQVSSGNGTYGGAMDLTVMGASPFGHLLLDWLRRAAPPDPPDGNRPGPGQAP